MRRHFDKKKICPIHDNDIDLTDVIKQHILDNHFYRIPKPPKIAKIINNTINNNYNIANFVSNMVPMQKLNEYTKYKSIAITPFENVVDLMYEKEREELDNNTRRNYKITKDDIFNIIDSVTKIGEHKVGDFNIMYDPIIQKILINETDGWKEYLHVTGLKMIVKTIQEYFWNFYEFFLIRKTRSNDIKPQEKQECRELLSEYYTFLSGVDVEPHVKDTCNNKILYTSDTDDRYWIDSDEYGISEEHMAMYAKVKAKMTDKERNKWKKQLSDLLKQNTKRNINDLNKMIIQLINIDSDFKKDMLEGIQV